MMIMKTVEKIIAALGLAAVISPLVIKTNQIIDDEQKRNASRRALSAMYEPVGNGGALYEAYHDPTEKRAKMYDLMDRMHLAIMDSHIENARYAKMQERKRFLPHKIIFDKED